MQNDETVIIMKMREEATLYASTITPSSKWFYHILTGRVHMDISHENICVSETHNTSTSKVDKDDSLDVRIFATFMALEDSRFLGRISEALDPAPLTRILTGASSKGVQSGWVFKWVSGYHGSTLLTAVHVSLTKCFAFLLDV